jgi:septum formation protein
VALRLYLASQSPRRKELLERAKIRFQVYVPKAAELKAPSTTKKTGPRQIVKRIAAAKAEACARELRRKGQKSALILAADTLVFQNGKVLGKPRSAAEAARMLGALSGRWHTVHTAVTVLLDANGKTRSKTISVATRVKFFQLEAEWIRWYVATGEPFDKAGSYGAQGYGAALVEKFSGSYTNVVGLPLGQSLALLEEVSGMRRSSFQKKAGR